MSDILRKAFADIAVGYSHGVILDRPCYIKHLSYVDHIDYERKRDSFFNEAKNNGILTNEERLNQIIKTGEWSAEKDKEVSTAKAFLEGLNNTKAKSKHPSMIAGLNKQILEQEEKISKIENEKRSLMGLTCEIYADTELNDHYIFTNVFLDKDLKTLFFKDEESEYFNNLQMLKISKEYSASIEGCSEKNIKKLAMSGIFQKYFSLCGDNISTFFGKPICDLTFYQVDLLKYGSIFQHIYSNAEVQNWPKNVFEDPDMLMDYANTVAKGKQDAQKQGAYEEGALVLGANKEDAKALGLKTNNNLAKQVVQNGGNLLQYLSKNTIKPE